MSLAAWHALSSDAAHTVACFGDSTTEGTGQTNPAELSWPAILRTRLSVAWGRQTNGFLGPWRDDYLTFAGTPTQSATSDTWNRGPFSIDTLDSTVFRLNSSTDIATYTVRGAPVQHVKLYVIDGPSSGNFSVSIDGGAFANVSNTWSQDLSMDLLTINGPISSTLRIRGANAAGTTVLAYLVGVEADYNAAAGAVVHNVGSAGAFGAFLVRLSGDSGDWGAWLDRVQPAVATWMFTNDVTALWNPTNWQARAEAFVDRVRANGGEAILMSFYEQGSRSITDQAEARSRLKTVAAAKVCPLIDFYDLVGDAAAAVAAGLMPSTSDVHATTKGHRYIADRVFNLLGRQRASVRARV